MGEADVGVGAANAPILIVESDADLSAAMKELLVDEGFAVDTAPAPDQAVPLLHASYYSLVLTDYVFEPLARSEQLARELQVAAAQVPIGCVTAWNAIPPAIAAHYVFVLQVPIEAERLLAAVARFAAVQAPDAARARVIARYFDALGRGDWDAVTALCAESVRYHLPGADPLSRTLEGRQVFRAYTAETFRAFPNASFEVIALGWLPHGVVASYRGNWGATEHDAQTATGDVYFRFHGQQISEIGVRTDVGRLRKQMSPAT
jgi:ketosteroid isomerase-like protein/CheY-like chemotaxis protein